MESPKSVKSFSALVSHPIGDDESINEEHSSDMMDPSEIMQQRFTAINKMNLPAIDSDDIGTKRQFAPEYSQYAYMTMIKDEYPIGNYTGQKYAKMHISSK